MQEKKITHAGNIKRDRRYGEQEELNFLSDAGKFINLQGEQINKEVVVKLNSKTHQLPDTKIGDFYFENKMYLAEFIYNEDEVTSFIAIR